MDCNLISNKTHTAYPETRRVQNEDGSYTCSIHIIDYKTMEVVAEKTVSGNTREECREAINAALDSVIDSFAITEAEE